MKLLSHIFRLGILAGLLVLITGMGASTDLTNIGTIYPDGTTLTIDGSLDLNGNSLSGVSTSGDFVDRTGDSMSGNLDMAGYAITNIDWANSDNPNTDASTTCSGSDYLAGDGTCNVDSYEQNTDNQDLSNVVGQGGTLNSGQKIDASSGGFILPTSPP